MYTIERKEVRSVVPHRMGWQVLWWDGLQLVIPNDLCKEPPKPGESALLQISMSGAVMDIRISGRCYREAITSNASRLEVRRNLLMAQARAEMLQARRRATTPAEHKLLDDITKMWPTVLLQILSEERMRGEGL
jgi:hypothetical protein